MNTRNKELERLVAQTNQLLTQMISQVSAGVEELDVSLDDLVAAETGETRATVQGRQSTGQSPRSASASTPQSTAIKSKARAKKTKKPAKSPSEEETG